VSVRQHDIDVPVARPAFPTGRQPVVSLVILCWNGLALTRRCIDSLRQTVGVEYRLIVVDNGSHDGTSAWLAQQPGVTLITLPQNLGYTRGNNVALARIPADHDVVLLNNDTEIVDPHWLAHLRDVANGHHDHGIVGCLLFHTNGRLQHAGVALDHDSMWCAQIGGGQQWIGQYPGVRDVIGITGACMYIRRDVRALLGGLDEAYVSYFEDTDYCLRARAAGFRVVCTGGTSLLHHENSSSAVNRIDLNALLRRSHATFVRRWREQLASRFSHGIHWIWAGPGTPAAATTEAVAPLLAEQGIDVRLRYLSGSDARLPPGSDPVVPVLQLRPEEPRYPRLVCGDAHAALRTPERTIAFVPQDLTDVPPDELRELQRFAELWVADPASRAAVQAAGVTRPITQIDAGVDTELFHPAITARRPARRTMLLLLDDPALALDCSAAIRYVTSACTASDGVLVMLIGADSTRWGSALAQAQPGSEIACIVATQLSASQRAVLYRSADALLVPHHGVRWAGIIREAQACGLAVLASDRGSAGAALARHGGIRLPCPGQGDDAWIAAIRDVVQNPAATRGIGAAAAASIQSLSWRHSARQIAERLRQLASQDGSAP
jgi:GT2 family glycosyltransferase